jgi:predicted unusual protein kinase regulating ubiquinone biosynthesis (AarF/ABC1/UbiB family)
VEYTSQRLLTLGFLHGRHLADVPRSELEHLDVRAIARDLLSAYMKQVAVDGVFHCDPHPGNLLLTDDGRLALMDFGMVGRFDASQKDNMILFLLAFSERLGERVAEIYLDMIERPEGLHQRGFTQDVCGLVTHYQKEDVYDWLETYGQIEQDLVDLLEQSFKPDPPAEVLLDPTHFPSSRDPTHPCSTPGKCSATPSRNWRIAARS